MNIIKRYLSKWLDDPSKNIVKDIPSNSVLFKVDENQKIHLLVNVDNFSPESADKFALLLFLLNEGYYVQTFIDLLMDLSKEGDTQNSFVKEVISKWNSSIIESDIYTSKFENEPVIKPTYFNNKTP